MNYLEDFGLHFVAGIGASMLDRRFSRNAKSNTERRIEEKTRQVAALDYIRGVQSNPDKEAVKSRDYLEAIVAAKSYFRTEGKQTEKGIVGFVKETLETARSYSERFNNLKWDRKLLAAYATEFAGDLVVGASQSLVGVGSFVASLGKTTYQGAALWLGMQAGKYIILAPKDYFTKSKEEKALDEMAREITSDGKLLDIVRSYKATAAVEVPKTENAEANADVKSNVAGYAGEIGAKAKEQASVIAGKVAGGVKSGFNAVLSEVRKLAEQRAAAANAKKEEQEKQKAEWRKRYDNY